MNGQKQQQILDQLRHQGACEAGILWVEESLAEDLSLSKVWKSCNDPSYLAWMLWIFIYLKGEADPEIVSPGHTKRMRNLGAELTRERLVTVEFVFMEDLVNTETDPTVLPPTRLAELGEMARLTRKHFPWKIVGPIIKEALA